ncbi:similar to Saccharomyces cerevisiae YLR085C ARP6 Actin-related protein that binds nucleosomes [Maudiozyma barnettii]|uniref:Actin-like protein ARP6 n=1 Tax=Maudiozyma barnettii TaxID=61262 RepID=A0A8H2ZKT3_9SACH|nr:Arp6p [Kazachstania barnettii]CAB4255487.1 similar to Saccharomyces cerevisiae YLR085C ARP6 Actin-related protein that binds nucleosomes [Kazachstania barnettii]CAD1783977.1 similar to Saccharomyces cerevisiae YLR085C ARP6 Actin-related protein that binds nucleosomes [Kazachstania barnettii]
MEGNPVVIDNGSYNIKFGLAEDGKNKPICKPLIAHNCLVKDKYGVSYLSNQVERIKDISSATIRRPHELGQLVSWELESHIWDYCLFNPDEFDGFDIIDSSQKDLVLSEACITVPELGKHTDQVVFEEYDFKSMYKTCTAGFIPFISSDKYRIISGKDIDDSLETKRFYDNHDDAGKGTKKDYRDYQLVIDSGFDCTYIVPVIKGIPVYKAVKKLDIGGRFLNGLLKETLSFRHYNMMDESILVDEIKEKCLFVSPTSYFDSFKKKDESSVVYALPDFQTSVMGYVVDSIHPLADNGQSITLRDELFSIPETFFHPEIAQLLKPGIVETILESLSMLPEVIRPLMVSNIVCTGGNFNLPNFGSRLCSELQRQLPTDWTCRIALPKGDCSLFGWEAMQAFAQTETYRKNRVTREEYLEHGAEWCTKNRFGYQTWI